MSLRKVKLKSEWVLTQAAFDGFLAILDRDRDKAREKYEYFRLKLLKYFQWCGSDVPDIDADETINREFGKAAWPTSAVTFGPPEVFGSLNWPT